MTGLALSGVTAMLAVYLAGLFVLLQTTADRYSVRLLPALLRRIAPWPVAFLLLLLVTVGILAILPQEYVASVTDLPIVHQQPASALLILPLALGFALAALGQSYYVRSAKNVLQNCLPLAFLLAGPDIMVASSLERRDLLILRELPQSTIRGLSTFDLVAGALIAWFIALLYIFCAAVFIDLLLRRVIRIDFLLWLVRRYWLWIGLLLEYYIVTNVNAQGSRLVALHRQFGGYGLLVTLITIYSLLHLIFLFFPFLQARALLRAWKHLIPWSWRIGIRDQIWFDLRRFSYILFLGLFISLAGHIVTGWFMSHTHENVAVDLVRHLSGKESIHWDAAHVRLEILFGLLLCLTVVSMGGAIQATLFRDNTLCLVILALFALALCTGVALPRAAVETISAVPLTNDTIALPFVLISVVVAIGGLYKAWLIDDVIVFQAIKNESFETRSQTLRDTLHSAVEHEDEPLITGLMQTFIDSYKALDLLDWFVKHPQILKSEWLSKELETVLTLYRPSINNIEVRLPLLEVLLEQAVVDNNIQRATSIINRFCVMLVALTPWSQEHRNYLEPV